MVHYWEICQDSLMKAYSADLRKSVGNLPISAKISIFAAEIGKKLADR
jgi:hypothetical protein